MSAVDELFAKLKADGKKAFMPFITAGDPDLKTTSEIMQSLDSVGCHICELGIPFSDPIADGPTIQASYTRALDGGVRLEKILDMVGSTVPKISMPVVTMVSYSIVWRRGIDAYLDAAQRAGVSGLIVPDLPVEESAALGKQCAERDMSLIQLITPTTKKDRAEQIAERATGFIYYVSVAGITGERTEMPADITDNLNWLREKTDTPICVGFGISSPETVRMLKPHADGLIVGSAIVRRIQSAIEAGQAPQDSVSEFCRTMIAALDE